MTAIASAPVAEQDTVKHPWAVKGAAPMNRACITNSGADSNRFAIAIQGGPSIAPYTAILDRVRVINNLTAFDIRTATAAVRISNAVIVGNNQVAQNNGGSLLSANNNLVEANGDAPQFGNPPVRLQAAPPSSTAPKPPPIAVENPFRSIFRN